MSVILCKLLAAGVCGTEDGFPGPKIRNWTTRSFQPDECIAETSFCTDSKYSP